MIELTAAEIAQAAAGRLHGVHDPQRVIVTSADTDSRHITSGALFIAKPGETADGHEFIDAARNSGAVLVLAERETHDAAGLPTPAVIVEDAVKAMGALAAEIVTRIRAHSPTTVIGITGSAGKTTTKDLLAAILSPEGPTIAPQGSYNGEVGVPLTVFTAELDTRYLIVEMGADAPGNVRELCDMVRPDIGAVLMVGSAHAEKFGGTEKIASAKGELAEAVGREGHLILNYDDAQVRAMAARTQAPISWVSNEPSAPGPYAVFSQQVMFDQDGHPQLTLNFAEEQTTTTEYRLRSGLTGGHHITNLLAAAAVAFRAGVAPAAIAERLDGLGPTSRWRMERTERADGVTVINDAYNANPESMREALRTLAIVTRDAGRRSVAVLGGMLELGAASTLAHHQIGETVVRLNIDLTLVVGDVAYALYRGAIAEGSWGNEVHWVATAEEAGAWLNTALQPGDVVLFKSSRDAGLRLLGDQVAGKEGAA